MPTTTTTEATNATTTTIIVVVVCSCYPCPWWPNIRFGGCHWSSRISKKIAIVLKTNFTYCKEQGSERHSETLIAPFYTRVVCLCVWQLVHHGESNVVVTFQRNQSIRPCLSLLTPSRLLLRCIDYRSQFNPLLGYSRNSLFGSCSTRGTHAVSFTPKSTFFWNVILDTNQNTKVPW